MTDYDIEQISQRVAELLFFRFMRRVNRASQVTETVKTVKKPHVPAVQPTAAHFEAVKARMARKGR